MLGRRTEKRVDRLEKRVDGHDNSFGELKDELRGIKARVALLVIVVAAGSPNAEKILGLIPG